MRSSSGQRASSLNIVVLMGWRVNLALMVRTSGCLPRGQLRVLHGYISKMLKLLRQHSQKQKVMVKQGPGAIWVNGKSDGCHCGLEHPISLPRTCRMRITTRASCLANYIVHTAGKVLSFRVETFVFCTKWFLDLVENKCLPIINMLPCCRHADV